MCKDAGAAEAVLTLAAGALVFNGLPGSGLRWSADTFSPLLVLLQALAKMGALRRLSLDASHSGYLQGGLPLAALERFARLALLESLELHLPHLWRAAL